MRRIAAIILMILTAGWASAADDPRRAQVAAATADALGALREDVLATPVTSDVTVQEFIEKTDSGDLLSKALRRAEQIGGTRWLDDQTCQVRLELLGSEVADTLVQIASTNPRDAGFSADLLRERVAGLRETTFAATGMSTSATDRLRPFPEQVEWRGVPDAVIRQAVGEARRSAARQVVESVEAIEMPGASAGALGKLLQDQQVRDALEGWAMNRPVTSVKFEDDLEVRVAVAVTGEDFWDELVAAVGDRTDLPFPANADARRELRAAVLRRVEPAVGRALAKEGGASGVARADGQTVEIPQTPPQWVARPVNARGRSGAVGSRLKTARVAENAGRDALRQRIEQLSLTPQMTLGNASRRDERVREAIARTVDRAKVRKVNYLADGGAEVSFNLDLRELWHELESGR